jgi:hypothetical protein
MDTSRMFTVTLSVFGLVVIEHFEATDEADAIKQALARAGFEISVVPRQEIDDA